MARYVFNGERFVDRDTGEPMAIPDRAGLCVPQIVADIEPYLSPVDGKYVSGRAAKRDDLKRTNCVEYDDLPRPKGLAPKGKFRNKRFAAKHNLPQAEDAR